MAQVSAKIKMGDRMNRIAWKLGVISYPNNITRTTYNISASIIGKAATLINKEYKIGEVRKEVEAKWVALGIKKIEASRTYESGEMGKFAQRFVWQSITSPLKNALNDIRGITIILNDRKQEQLRKQSEELALRIQKTFADRFPRDEV